MNLKSLYFLFTLIIVFYSVYLLCTCAAVPAFPSQLKQKPRKSKGFIFFQDWGSPQPQPCPPGRPSLGKKLIFLLFLVSALIGWETISKSKTFKWWTGNRLRVSRIWVALRLSPLGAPTAPHLRKTMNQKIITIQLSGPCLGSGLLHEARQRPPRGRATTTLWDEF